MEADFLEQIKGRDIDLMVCTDSEAILGIGDQGVGVNLSVSLSDAVHEQSTSLGHWGIPSRSFLQPGLTILLTRSQLRNLLSTREQAQPCVGDFDKNFFLVFLLASIPLSLCQWCSTSERIMKLF